MDYKDLILPAAALSVVALWQGVQTRYDTLPSPKAKQGQAVRILQLSDLHSTLYGQGQTKLIARMQKTNPDLILLTGDIFDDRRAHGIAMPCIRAAVKLAPTFYVTGNHEYRDRAYPVPRRKRILQNAGVHVLSGDVIPVQIKGQTLLLCGVDDCEGVGVSECRRQVKACADFIKKENLSDGISVLLLHRPVPAFYANTHFDFVFSGHVHGGQARIPFTDIGILSPTLSYFPRYSGGIYRKKNTYHIVSRGLSKFLTMPRIFNPPELRVIDIVNPKELPHGTK